MMATVGAQPFIPREPFPAPLMGNTNRFPSPAPSNVSRGGDQFYIHERSPSPDATIEYPISPQRPSDEWSTTFGESYYHGQNLYYQNTTGPNITSSESRLNRAFQLSSGTPPPDPQNPSAVPDPLAVIPNPKGCLSQTKQQSPIGTSSIESYPLLAMQHINMNLESSINTPAPKRYLLQLSPGKKSPPDMEQSDVSLPNIESSHPPKEKRTTVLPASCESTTAVSSHTIESVATVPPPACESIATVSPPACESVATVSPPACESVAMVSPLACDSTTNEDMSSAYGSLLTPCETDKEREHSLYTPPDDEGKMSINIFMMIIYRFCTPCIFMRCFDHTPVLISYTEPFSGACKRNAFSSTSIHDTILIYNF